MNRRELITLLGGAGAAWPLAAGAQQQAAPIVGFFHPSSPEFFGHIVNGFRRGLNDAGFVEGQSVEIEFRWARGEYNRLPALAAELVQLRVRVIMAVHSGNKEIRLVVRDGPKRAHCCDDYQSESSAARGGRS
jgi:putative ABC transport system substrate-binding protein